MTSLGILDSYTDILRRAELVQGPMGVVARTNLRPATEEWFLDWYDQFIVGAKLFIPALTRLRLQHAVTIVPGLTDVRKALELVQALDTRANEAMAEHVESRHLDQDGNLFIGYTGPTGSAKSSCSLHDAFGGEFYPSSVKTRQDLHDRLFIWNHEADRVLQNVPKGEACQKDENPFQSGAGADADQLGLKNKFDMIRKGQKSIHVCSPEIPERSTFQFMQEGFAYTSLRDFKVNGEGRTLWLINEGGVRTGTRMGPWCDATTWSWYDDWKADVVAGAEAGHGAGMGRVAQYIDLLIQARAVDRGADGHAFNPLVSMIEASNVKGRSQSAVFRELFEFSMRVYNLDQRTVEDAGKLAWHTLQTIDSVGSVEDGLRGVQDLFGFEYGQAAVEAFRDAYTVAGSAV